MLHTYDVVKLDILRIYRYLNKYLGIENKDLEPSLVIKLGNDIDDNCNNEENDE
jgi:hypothetical protein